MKSSSPESVETLPVPAASAEASRTTSRLPLALKIGYTAFMAVLVPVYWVKYGPGNFLYFCDVALFLTLVALWTENAFLASMAAVGILLPQMVWCADFAAHLAGFKITGMTDYMFDSERSLFLRGLSLFHGWLPFLLVFLVARLGFDRRGLKAWTVTAWGLMLVCYFFMPRPGAALPNPKAAVNINYVFGFSDEVAQTWMPELAWLSLLLVGLPTLVYLPTNLVLKKFFRPATAAVA
jgi:hypothetical protein